MVDLVVVQGDAGTAVVQETAFDILVVQETGNTVVVQETAPADLVEVVAVGPQGGSGTIQVGSVTTGPAGSSASVTNAGTSTDAVLNFQIPKGDTGDVTPELTAAKNAAEAAAAAAASSQGAAATSATNAATSATSAAASADTATTKATQASNSATSAGASATEAAGSAATASAKASDATASATSAANSATASAASATSSQNSAANSAVSATTATTKASDAAASATAAANSAADAASSATSASTSATTATTQAGIATTKASDASTSAANAATSATSAAGSATTATTKATDAATSATNAANSATSAGASAATATTKATEAAASATSASGSATAAASSATSASTSATTATTQAGIATTKASDAATSATNAATSATSAGASATTATTQAANASTSATSAAGSATSAATSATNAASSATSASDSASTATTQASNAATSAASALSSKNAAATSETNAATSATAAAGSASTASTAATTATTQASNAATSATNAAASATAAEAAAAGSVRFDQAQSLSGTQQAQARSNIGLATVASSGAYADLIGKPTAVSSFTNDAGYLTSSSLSGYLTTASAASTYQPLLVSGTSIKTINGASLLGSGDVTITAGVSSFNTRTGAITLTSGDVTGALGFTPENVANKNAANGYAGLDSTGKVAAAQLPSFVDDVIEAANFASLPGTGETGKIYVTLDTNKTYRWSGSAYIEISASPGSTDSLTEGSVNLYFTTARARSAISVTGAGSYNASTGVIDITGGVTSVNGYTGAVSLTKTDLGLANVENKSSATIRGELTSSNVTTALGFTPYDAANPGAYINQAGARSAVSASGSLSYNATTGVFSYTAPTNVSAFTNDAGYLTGITSSQVTSALGFTPYNATNPGGYVNQAGARSAISVIQNLSYNSSTGVITGPDLSGYLTSATAASTYQTQSGMSSYLTSATAASTYLPLAGGTLTGNLTLSTGTRITGDFSNTTIANRVLVQTSAVNSSTVFGLLPSGTAVNSQFHVWGAADPTNAPLGAFTINANYVQIQSSAAGTGTTLPFRVLVGTSEVLRATTSYNLLIGSSVDDGINKFQLTGSAAISGNLNFGGTGNRITGDFSNATVASRAAFQSSTANGNTLVNAIPNGTATVSRWGALNGSDPANASVFSIGITATAAEIVSTYNGTGSYLPIDFYTGGSARGRIGATSGNWLIGTTTDNGTDKLQVSGTVNAAGLTLGSNPAGRGTALNIGGYNADGGTGYHGVATLTNTYGSATNPNKFIRLNSTGGLEIVNSAYTGVIFALSDAGALSNVTIDAGVITTGTINTARLGSGTANSTTYLRGDGTWAAVAGGGGGSGTVTSVAMTVPTGLSVTGSPITTTGSLDITFAAGYSIPTTASQTNWDTAYTDRNKWDGGSTGLVASTARTSLGLVIGTNVQAWDVDLDAIAALGSTAGVLTKTGVGAWSVVQGLSLTSLSTITQNGAFNTTTPGLTDYGLKFVGALGTNDRASGMTWTNASDGGTTAGIYVQTSSSYGSKMYLATSDSPSTGAKNAISIDQTGLVNFIRQRPTYAGNTILDAGNYSTYAQPANANLTSIVTLGGGATNGLLKRSAANTWVIDTSTYLTAAVTSVGGTGTVSGLTLTGTVTSTGNLTLGGTLSVLPSNFASQTANTVLAGPTTGVAAAPTFRALVSADLPTYTGSLTSSQVTTALGFTPLSNATSYLPLSGGTLTGGLVINSGGVNQLQLTSPSGTQNLWVRAGYDANGTGTPQSSAYNVEFQSSGSSGGTFTFVTGNDRTLSISGSAVNSYVALQQSGNQVLHAGNYTSYAASIAADGCIQMNNQTISNNYTMPASVNGVSAGPITIATGVTVTISTGANWVIV